MTIFCKDGGIDVLNDLMDSDQNSSDVISKSEALLNEFFNEELIFEYRTCN